MIPDLNYLPGSLWKKVSENRNYFLSENPVFAIVCNAAICNRTMTPVSVCYTEINFNKNRKISLWRT
jgi:hypothetical protein